ncbi:MAG: HD domain-containing phosphohydrolase [Desulfuromonadales bacterium]
MSDVSISHEINEFIRHLLSAVAAAGLYGMNHQQVTRLTDVAHASLARTLALRSDIAMLEVDGELIIDGEPQPFSMVLDRFAQYLRGNGIGHLRFLAGGARPEFNRFIAALAHQPGMAELGSSEFIRVGRLDMPEHGDESGRAGTGGIGTKRLDLRELPGVELARLTEVYEAVNRKERFKPSGVTATVAELVEAFNREGEAILMLAALREQDEYTFTHAANVCILTMAQAISLGIQGQLLNDIGMAAMLHDIGKMFVPEEILTKPGKLTEEEIKLMRLHPVKGGRYLMETSGIPQLAGIVAYEHHMFENSGGYPAAPSGWKLNLASQMTTIADVFDAMRTRRSYKEPLSPRKIANMLLEKAGKEFNPQLVTNFLHLLARLKKL